MHSHDRQLRPLSDWLGWKVQYKGFMTNWMTLEDGTRKFFFETVLIKPWVHLHGEHKARQIDHLWVYLDDSPIPVSNKAKIKRFDQMVGTGVVVRYWRKDGTPDYGIDHQAASHLDKAIYQLKNRRFSSFKDAAFITGELINAIDQGVVLVPFGDDPTSRRNKLEKLRDFYLSQQPAEERYEEIKRQNALKPQPCVDILTFPKREKTSVAGFTRNSR